MASRPAAVAFDVNDTLISYEAFGPRLRRLGLPPDQTLQVWFHRVLRDGFAHAATGTFAEYLDLTRHHLAMLLRAFDIDSSHADEIMDGFGELDAHPDAAPALERLRSAGVGAVSLTNGHPQVVRDHLSRTGLDELLDDFLSISEIKAWKPGPEPYRYAAEVCGTSMETLGFVAVHSWDIHGANRAGATTGYGSRLEGTYVPGFAPPDVTAERLDDVVDGLLALPPPAGG